MPFIMKSLLTLLYTLQNEVYVLKTQYYSIVCSEHYFTSFLPDVMAKIVDNTCTEEALYMVSMAQ